MTENKLIKNIKRGRKKPYRQDGIELALLWCDGGVTFREMKRVMKLGSEATVYSFLARALRQYVLTKEGK